MSIRNPYAAYENNSVTTAAPGELTLMLYNGCIKFIKQAKRGMEEKNYEMKNRNIQKAQNIISELMVTLNMDIPVSQQMMQMYDYMNRRLIEANIQNKPDLLDEVESYVVEFRDTWKEVVLINRKAQHSGSERA